MGCGISSIEILWIALEAEGIKLNEVTDEEEKFD
jgi:hypothetical protein